MKTPKVFLSYSREDASYANEIARALRDRGLETWFDCELTPGGDWVAEIESAMLDADLILILISDSYYTSNFASYERGLALQRQQALGSDIIVPVLLPGIRDDALPSSLRNLPLLTAAHGVEPVADEVARLTGA